MKSFLLRRVPKKEGGEQLDNQTLAATPDYTFSRLLIRSRFSEIVTFAYVLQPTAAPVPGAAIVLLHGSGTLPQQAFNLRFNGEGGVVTRPDSTPFIGLGLALARAGFTVIAPIIGANPGFNRGLPWLDVSLWGHIFRNKTGEGGSETLLVAEIRAFIDYAIQNKLARANQVYLAGWKEGAYLAALTASSDDRVRAVVSLSAPFDRRQYRASEIGILRDASFAHADCRVGDLAQAIMLGGRPLLYASADNDAEERLRRRYRNPAIVDSIQSFYKAVGRPNDFVSFLDAPGADVQKRVVSWLVTVAGVDPQGGARIGVPRVSRGYRFPAGDLQERANTTGGFLSRLPPCRSMTSFVLSSDPAGPSIRTRILDAIAARGAVAGAGLISRRAPIDSSRGYRLSLVLFGRPGSVQWRALLAEPPGASAPGPAILSFNGDDNLDDLFAVGRQQTTPYMHGYADAFARRGFVVLVPIVPAWVPDAFAALSAAQTGGKSRVWAALIEEYTEALDALLKLNNVDANRVAAYGISFGGTAAAIMSAVDTRIKSVVYNNVPYDFAAAFNRPAGAFTNLWAADACSVIDASLLAIAPRPMTWEAGEDPLLQNNGMNIITRMRERYRNFGAEESFTFKRHWGGHETFPDELRIFGR